MDNQQSSQFSRVYKRPSWSLFNDASTLLLLADVINENSETITLGYDTYIYLHRSSSGQNLGISISKR